MKYRNINKVTWYQSQVSNLAAAAVLIRESVSAGRPRPRIRPHPRIRPRPISVCRSTSVSRSSRSFRLRVLPRPSCFCLRLRVLPTFTLCLFIRRPTNTPYWFGLCRQASIYSTTFTIATSRSDTFANTSLFNTRLVLQSSDRLPDRTRRHFKTLTSAAVTPI